MAECDGWFDAAAIPFEASFRNQAVRAVMATPGLTIPEKKWLVQCWFDHVYGYYRDGRAEITAARQQMADFIRKSPYTTFEELFEDNLPEG